MIDFFDIIPSELIVPFSAILILHISKLMFKIVLYLGGEPEMGYVAPSLAPKLNLDKFGLPKDYATYVWLLYKKRVNDESPNRRAFLGQDKPYFGFSMQYDEQ